MADHSAQTTVTADPDTVYEYLSDVRHLPEYFPMMTEAEPVPGEDAVRTTAVLDAVGTGDRGQEEPREVRGEAWFRTDGTQRQVRWGSEGPSDYHGELRVTPDGDGARVHLLVHVPDEHDGRDRTDAVQESLERALDAIATGIGPAGQGG